MSALEALRKRGPSKAYQIAHDIGKPIEDVYAELVAAEARELARVVVSQKHASSPDRKWEAM